MGGEMYRWHSVELLIIKAKLFRAMSSSQERMARDKRITDKMKTTALGVAYLLVGVRFFYSLATDSVQLLTAVLPGVVGLILLSLAIIIRREGLITPENRVISVFVLLAMGLLFGLYEFTTLSLEIVFGIVFILGVIFPHLLLQYSGSSEILSQ